MKNAIVIISDPVSGTGEAAARMFNGLAMAFDCKEAGDDVNILFHGPGTHWPRHLEAQEHPAHQLYESVKDRITGVSETCAAHFGANVSGFKKISENLPPNPHGLGLPSLRKLQQQGYQVTVF